MNRETLKFGAQPPQPETKHAKLGTTTGDPLDSLDNGPPGRSLGHSCLRQ
jgi:hypothetical protein